MTYTENIKQIFSILISALLLISAAIYNGYPIVYSDTSTYLVSGFELIPPFDRPITYGLFLRITSLNGLTLWIPLLFQSMVIVYPVKLLVREYTGFHHHHLLSLGIIAVLSVTSALSFVSSNLIADIFTPASLLCLILLLTRTGLTNRERNLLYVLFFVSHCMHLSHLGIHLLFIPAVILFRKISSPDLFIISFYRNVIILGILLIFSYPIMSAPISKFKHVFFMGRMAESGILYEYLAENCPNKEMQLCRYMDSLPDNAADFAWDPESPLNKIGGWKGSRDEFEYIIRETLTTPRFMVRHIEEAIKSTLRQFGRFKAGDGNGSFLHGTLLFERIQKYVPRESDGYLSSRQNRSGALQPGLRGFNRLSLAGIIVSLALLILSLVIPNIRTRMESRHFLLYILLGTAIVCSNAINASLGTVTDRYGAKVMWFLPLAGLLLLFQIFHIFIKPSNKE